MTMREPAPAAFGTAFPGLPFDKTSGAASRFGDAAALVRASGLLRTERIPCSIPSLGRTQRRRVRMQ